MTEVSFRVSFSLFTLRRVVLCWLRSRGCGGGRVRGGLRRELSPPPQENRLLLRSLGVRGSFRFLEAKRRFAFWACCSSWKAVLESSPEYVIGSRSCCAAVPPARSAFLFFWNCKSNSRPGTSVPAPETVPCRGKTELA